MTTREQVKHTPRPWQSDATNKYYSRHVIRHNGLIVATVEHSPFDSTQDAEQANARLIAAAPEMLEALENAAMWLGKMIADGAHKNAVAPRHCEVTLDRIEKLIAKAKGEL